MEYPIPAEVGDFSELRRLNKYSTTDGLIVRRGVLAKLENNGTVSTISLTGVSYPTGNLLSGVTALLGVVTKDYAVPPDPVAEQTQEYGGQIESTTPKVHVALLGAHREIILPTINSTNGEPAPSDAVASNIGKGVTVKAQNYFITVGNNRHWCYPAVVLGGNDGIIVGLAGKGRVIVRLRRGFFVELQ